MGRNDPERWLPEDGKSSGLDAGTFITEKWTPLHEQGETVTDDDIARLSPLRHAHIHMLRHYSFTQAELVSKGHLRSLKETSEEENIDWREFSFHWASDPYTFSKGVGTKIKW